MATEDDVLVELHGLEAKKQWPELEARAIAATAEFPTNATIVAYVAHAKRQLNDLEQGYTWAVRGVELDPLCTFASNRVSLLANLTGRYQAAYAIAVANVDSPVPNAQEALNVAVTIVNGIFAAHKLDCIADAVIAFTPAILRLDHVELHYNAACLYALAHDERAFTYIAKSLAANKPKSSFAEPDFDNVRADQRFVDLLARDWAAEAGALQRANRRERAELCAEDFVDPTKLASVDPVDATRNSDLERAIDADIDDLAGYLVYCDWLQERDSPRGTVVLANRRCEQARTENERMLAFAAFGQLLSQHSGALFGPLSHVLARASRARWRHGFVSELVFDTGYTRSRRGPPVDSLLRTALGLPVCRFLRALSIGDITATDQLSFAPVVAVLRSTELPHVRSLVIKPTDYQLSWTHLDTSGLGRTLPALESLLLGAGDLTIGELELPRLHRFAVHTTGLTHANVADIAAAEWPELEDLELWFGSPDHGADAFEPADIAALLGTKWRQLRRLALMNADFTNALVGTLVSAPVLRQLAVLDLSMGTLTDPGAAMLIANAPAFAHLATLSVNDNALSKAACSELREVLPNCFIGTQKDDRYVTVGE